MRLKFNLVDQFGWLVFDLGLVICAFAILLFVKAIDADPSEDEFKMQVITAIFSSKSLVFMLGSWIAQIGIEIRLSSMCSIDKLRREQEQKEVVR